MALAPGLIAAYKAAEYAAAGLVLRIGQRNRALDAFLLAEGCASAAFVTAANPRSERRPAAENAAALAALEAAVRAAGHRHMPGEGRDPTGAWPAEASLLVLGIARAEAEALGRSFGQNALVFVERGKAPELVLLR